MPTEPDTRRVLILNLQIMIGCNGVYKLVTNTPVLVCTLATKTRTYHNSWIFSNLLILRFEGDIKGFVTKYVKWGA